MPTDNPIARSFDKTPERHLFGDRFLDPGADFLDVEGAECVVVGPPQPAEGSIRSAADAVAYSNTA
jgi:hypothetical protein